VLGITLLLLAIGLVMVLSTSSATALLDGQAPYSGFQKQLLGVVIGLPLMWVASRSSPTVFRAIAYPAMGISVLGLVLVLAVGQTVGGGERWIDVAGFQIQPSEFAKFAFVLWGADLLARKERAGQLAEWRHLLLPLLPGAAILSMLVMLGDDLGTTFILLMIFLTLLWVIGSPARLFLGMLGLMGFAMVIMIIVAPYRMGRITGFLNPQAHLSTYGWQEIQGQYAIGSGGWFGIGLGAGKEKWGWVPNSTTDFIFAILGEELGLLGTLCVTFLYGGLAYAGLRIARRVQDTFMRLAAAAATGWIVAQALVNMGAVIGMLPITGVPLPLVSAGLSSLLVTMVALGMLMSFAKREAGARQALAAAGPGPALRVLSWLGLPARRHG
jgi:cell division protein FtsW